MSQFFYMFTSAMNLWRLIFVTADATEVFVHNQHGIHRRGQDFDNKSSSGDEIPERDVTYHLLCLLIYH